MSSSNDLTNSTPAEVTVPVSQPSETLAKSKATAVALGQELPSPAVVNNATPRSNGAAVTVYQQELWVIWSAIQNGGDAALISVVGRVDGGQLQWSLPLPLKDTEGNHIQSAFTPSITVLAGQMHLIVVKPDGRGTGTLAHYVYIDSLRAWEYNSGRVVQPQTTASPTIAAFSGLLYLAFIADRTVGVRTYTPSTTDGVEFGEWSDPAATGISSTQAPALFTSPRSTGAELHLAVASSTHIREYAMGSSIGEWNLSPTQPDGTTNGGVGACNTANEAFLTAATADVENPTPQYATWLEIRNRWYPWKTLPAPMPAAFSDVTCAVFNRMLQCFYVGPLPDGSSYTLWVVPAPLSPF